MSALTIVSYDKVRGRNKTQRWLRSVCVRFFITNITQPDTISQDTIMSYTTTPSLTDACFAHITRICSTLSIINMYIDIRWIDFLKSIFRPSLTVYYFCVWNQPFHNGHWKRRSPNQCARRISGKNPHHALFKQHLLL